MNFPDNLKYTTEHEWIRIEGPNGWIGITDYAQSELGDVVFVEIPAVGTKVEKGKSFGTIEAVKAVSDLFFLMSAVITVSLFTIESLSVTTTRWSSNFAVSLAVVDGLSSI